MKLLVLTEGGADIGFGHTARCLSLCQAFEARGWDTSFLVKGDDTVDAVLHNYRYDLYDWHTGGDVLDRAVIAADVAVIDSYLAAPAIYRQVADGVKTALYLDDTRRLEYPEGVVINWSVGAEDLGYPRRDGVSYLLGAEYVSLRRPFWNPAKRNVNKELKQVMITFGGDDSKNLTPAVLAFLARVYPSLKKHVIVGSAYTNTRWIEAVADENTRFIHSPDAAGMEAVMKVSDIAVSSGGQTLYELACLGVPTVAVSVAENQRNNVAAWAKTGFIENAGFWQDEDIVEQVENTFCLLSAYDRRVRSVETGQRLVPGNGADRIIDFINAKLSINN